MPEVFLELNRLQPQRMHSRWGMQVQEHFMAHFSKRRQRSRNLALWGTPGMTQRRGGIVGSCGPCPSVTGHLFQISLSIIS